MFSISYKCQIRFRKYKYSVIDHSKNVKIRHGHFHVIVFSLMLGRCLYRLIYISYSMLLMLVTICFCIVFPKGVSSDIIFKEFMMKDMEASMLLPFIWLNEVIEFGSGRIYELEEWKWGSESVIFTRKLRRNWCSSSRCSRLGFLNTSNDQSWNKRVNYSKSQSFITQQSFHLQRGGRLYL